MKNITLFVSWGIPKRGCRFIQSQKRVGIEEGRESQNTGTNWFGTSVKLPPRSMRLEKSDMRGAAWRCR